MHAQSLDWLRSDEARTGDIPFAATSAHDTRTAFTRVGSGPGIVLLHVPKHGVARLAPLVEAVTAGECGALVPDASMWRAVGEAPSLAMRCVAEAVASLGPVPALIAHGAAGAVALHSIALGAAPQRLVLIDPAADIALDDRRAPRTLVLRARRGATHFPRHLAADVRTVWLEASPDTMLSNPYVVATATEFALHGRLPVF